MRARLVSLALLSVACQRAGPPVPAPPAEFIVAAADSVFWIRSDVDGIRVRGAPMVLAQIGGRFAELYVSDADYSFYDAVFIGQQLFKRDIVSGDSVQLVADTLMPALARAYAAANPEERPLDADEQGSENPRTVATGDVTVLDVVGPWLSYEHLTDVDVVGGVNSHGARRGIVDLRTASAAPLDAIIGAAPARRAIAAARVEWGTLRDSLALLAVDSTLTPSTFTDRFAFDPRSFSLGVLDRALQVRFAVTQTGVEEEAGVLELRYVDVDQPDWWEAVSSGYPTDAQAADNALERIWTRKDFLLVGRPADSPQARVSLAIRDAAGSEWRLGSVPSPIQRVMWIGDTADVPGMRAALTKAFNDASFYSGENRIVNHTLRGQRPESFVRRASRLRTAPPPPRRLPPRGRARMGA